MMAAEASMPTVASVMADLKSKGNEKYRKTYARHGMAEDRVYGVSVADLKLIMKPILKAKDATAQQTLALGLYESGIMDAMYLAGMLADGAKMTEKQLQSWAVGAAGMQMISEYTVPWVAVEHPKGRELALKWMASGTDHVAASGWCTYSGLVATKADEALDLAEVEKLLGTIVGGIHKAQNRERHTMNNFVIAVGGYVLPLSQKAKAAARKIGVVTVDMGDTACEVPLATAYIEKMEAAGKAGKKKKTIRC
jgi:3-methyladenine DNA glycosylase AlkD